MLIPPGYPGQGEVFADLLERYQAPYPDEKRRAWIKRRLIRWRRLESEVVVEEIMARALSGDEMAELLKQVEAERDEIKADYHNIIRKCNTAEWRLDEMRAERNHLSSQNRRLRVALAEIVNPVRFMRKRARQQGARLDGMMACRLAEMPSHLQGIARKVLETDHR